MCYRNVIYLKRILIKIVIFIWNRIGGFCYKKVEKKIDFVIFDPKKSWSRLNFWKTCLDSKKITWLPCTWDVYGQSQEILWPYYDPVRNGRRSVSWPRDWISPPPCILGLKQFFLHSFLIFIKSFLNLSFWNEVSTIGSKSPNAWIDFKSNVWSIKIRTIHKLSLWLYNDFFGKSSFHIANFSCQDL